MPHGGEFAVPGIGEPLGPRVARVHGQDGLAGEFAVDVPEAVHGLVEGELLDDPLAGQPAEFGPALVVAEQGEGGAGHGLGLARRYDEAGVADGLADPADVGGDGGAAAGHGLDDAEGEALADGGEHDDAAGRVGPGHLLDAALVGDPVGHAEFGGELLQAELVLLAAGRDGPEEAQPQGGELLAHEGVGPDEGFEVLDRVDAAAPTEGGHVGFGAGIGEGVRVDAVVDGADAVGLRAPALLPAAVVLVARGDQVGLPVALGVELAVEAEHEGLDGPALGGAAVAEVALAQVDAVLGEQEGDPVEVLGGEGREGGEAAADGVRDAVGRDPDAERAQRVFQQVGGGERVVDGGLGLGGDEPGPGPYGHQQPQDRFGAQGRCELSGPGEDGQFAQGLGEAVPGGIGLGVEQGEQEALVDLGEAAVGPAAQGRPADARRERPPEREGGVPVDVAGQFPGDRLSSGAGQGYDVEVDLRHASHQLVAPGADAPVDVWIGAFGEHGDVTPMTHAVCPPRTEKGPAPVGSRSAGARWYSWCS